MPSLHKGVLIAIEGIDGSGKSTLAKNLMKLFHANQYNVVITKEPGDSLLGQKIRTLVQTQETPISSKAEFLLFAADRAQHFADVIIPALNQKKLIISDRLSDSSLAYQGYGRGLEKEHIQSINHWAMNGIRPDITIFITIPVTVALERISARNHELSTFETQSLLEKVACGFEHIYANRPDVITIDGTLSIESLTKHAYDTLEKWLITQ